VRQPADITSVRLHNQRLSSRRFGRPEDVVSWLGAVQAQEYPDTKWALGLRMQRASDGLIERAFAAGRILRTHVMRPTWHFVAPADIRWMLALTGPRVSAAMAPYNRRLELDATVFRRSRAAIARALGDGAQLTRQELKAVLQRAGIHADGVQRLAHIVMQAEIDAVICSGAPRGKHQTYVLIDQRVPASQTLSREEALAELARRYFTSHGPAQLQDFAWWSGLRAGDARAGLALAEEDLVRDTWDGKTYWLSPSARTPHLSGTAAYLLPLYDEYLIAYKDRSAALDREQWTRVASRDPFSAPVVVGGQVAGGWRRTVKADRVIVTVTPFTTFRGSHRKAVTEAAERYAGFLGLDLELVWAD
jgi:hypothetical protein